MTALVLDASVALKWIIEEEGTDAAIALLDQPLHAPDLLVPECVNALWKKVRRQEVAAGEIQVFERAIGAMEVTLHASRSLAARALQLAVAMDHAGYDCFYLALAERLKLPLVTADRRLQSKLLRSGGAGLGRLLRPLGAT